MFMQKSIFKKINIQGNTFSIRKQKIQMKIANANDLFKMTQQQINSELLKKNNWILTFNVHDEGHSRNL